MHRDPSESSTTGFSPLTLDQCAYRIASERVMLSVGKIANHRDPGDISGTLSVELWALDQPYSGGSFEGVPLAGTSIGEMRGQHFLPDCRYDLVFQRPPAGTWYLTVMLREWTAAGYTTRDYVNFALPYVVESPPIVGSESGDLISVEFAGNTQRSPAPAEIEHRVHPADTVPTKTSAPRRQAAEPEPGVSLNSASPNEIAAIKEMSEQVAEEVVAARSFRPADELPRGMGMGARLLHQVRRLLRL